jgi:NAD+ diphosphatase
MDGHFTPLIKPPADSAGPALWFIFQGGKMLVKTEYDEVTVPVLNCDGALEELGLRPTSTHYLGILDGRNCYAAGVPEDTRLPEGIVFQGVRSLYERLNKGLFYVVLRAKHVVEWDLLHQFCVACGARVRMQAGIRAKECPQCGYLDFPRISPAVITLVERDGKVLLARASRFQEEIYSVLAGFVEPGENLEETVRREIKEEVGIDVKDIRYFGSQPWPFPESLMLAFTATYAGGEICVDNEEILRAGWFAPDELPAIPGKISIARALIDWFIAKSDADLPSSK